MQTSLKPFYRGGREERGVDLLSKPGLGLLRVLRDLRGLDCVLFTQGQVNSDSQKGQVNYIKDRDRLIIP